MCSPEFVGDKREARRQEVWKNSGGDARDLRIVEGLRKALAEVQARPEAVCHHHVEVLGAADLELVEGLRVSVEEGRRELRAMHRFELGDDLLHRVGLPHQESQRRRLRRGAADERSGASDHQRAERHRARCSLQNPTTVDLPILRLGHRSSPLIPPIGSNVRLPQITRSIANKCNRMLRKPQITRPFSDVQDGSEVRAR